MSPADNSGAPAPLSDLRDAIAERIAELNDAINAAIVAPTPGAFDAVRAATDEAIQTLARVLVELGRWQERLAQTYDRPADGSMDDAVPRFLFDVASLRDKAATFRRLARDHEAAGNRPIAAKLVQVAAELEAKANRLDRGTPGMAPLADPPDEDPPSRPDGT